MYAIEEESAKCQTVTLYVTDATRSQDFYQDLFGMVLCEQADPRTSRTLRSVGGHDGVSIVLRPREGEEGPVWLSVEVGSVSEVLDLYLLAIMMGARAMLPRKRGERWNTVVTDPDQNRISIWTRVDDESEEDEPSALSMRPQRWDWRVTPPRGEMAEDELDRGMKQMCDEALGVPGRRDEGVSRVRGGGASGARGGTPYPGREQEVERRE